VEIELHTRRSSTCTSIKDKGGIELVRTANCIDPAGHIWRIAQDLA
jgi:hypothetical protein